MSIVPALVRPIFRGKAALRRLALAAASMALLAAPAFGQYPYGNGSPAMAPGMPYGGMTPGPGYPTAPGPMTYGPAAPYGGPAVEGAVPPEMFSGAPAAGCEDEAECVAPAMIGDFIGAGSFAGGVLTEGVGSAPIAIAAGGRRFRISENQTPVPTDRIFANYDHCANSFLLMDGSGRPHDINFDRVTVGLEKTFLGGLTSLEVRVPIGRGLDSDQSDELDGGFRNTEFGNVVLVGKGYLVRGCCWSLTGGLGISLPTADDASYHQNGQPVGEIENDSYHLQPFLGALWTPTNRLFFEGFAAADFDANGYDVLASLPDRGSRQVGTYNDQSLLILDMKVGYWLFRNRQCGHGWISGVAPTVELHYTGTMQDSDEIVVDGQTLVSDPLNQWDNFTITGGLHFLLWNESILTIYGAAPLHEDEARLTGSTSSASSSFDSQWGVQYNWYF